MSIYETLDSNALSLKLPPSLDNPGDWRSLTSDWARFSIYASEPYIRESIADADAVLGERLPVFTKRFTSLLIKPDALAGRRSPAICGFLADHGFRIADAVPFHFDRLMVRELWRYSMNISTNAKFDLVDRVHTASSSIYLLVEDVSPTSSELSAAARLQKLKGSAFKSGRTGRELRAVADSPNEILVLIHAPDEPLEMLRELGLLFDRPQRRSIFHAAIADAANGQAATALVAEVQSGIPLNELDVNRSAKRLADRFNLPGNSTSLHELWTHVQDLDLDAADPTTFWDSIMIGTSVVELSIAGMKKLIE